MVSINMNENAASTFTQPPPRADLLPCSPIGPLTVEFTPAMATPKRAPESPVDDDGFLPVQRKRRKKRDAPVTSAADGTPMFWRIAEHTIENPLRVVKWLHKEFKLLLRVDASRTGDFIIR